MVFHADSPCLTNTSRAVICICIFLIGSLILTEHLAVQMLPKTYCSNELHNPERTAGPRTHQNRTILFWTEFYSSQFVPGLTLYAEAVRDLENCPVQNCRLTNDRSLLAESDAVIFSAVDLSVGDLPRNRSPSQYFLFYALESPVHTHLDLSGEFNDYFNLTLTFRLDSDVVTDSYFQHFQPTLLKNRKEFSALWMNKTKMASALISNCNPVSQRDVYLQELSNYFPIDIYGKCGNLECAKAECDSKTTVNYKFYFAFENRDYVTEKLYRALNHGAIPVVYGAANYSKLFPRKSFINALDFNHPKDLAAHLIFLAHNWTAYEEYFKWRYSPDQMRLHASIQADKLSWCKICQIIHKKPRKTRTVRNLNRWWRDDGKCTVPEVDTSSSPARWLRNPVIPVYDVPKEQLIFW